MNIFNLSSSGGLVFDHICSCFVNFANANHKCIHIYAVYGFKRSHTSNIYVYINTHTHDVGLFLARKHCKLLYYVLQQYASRKKSFQFDVATNDDILCFGYWQHAKFTVSKSEDRHATIINILFRFNVDFFFVHFCH